MGPAAVRGTCGPLKHRCSGTLREDGGRASGGRWDPRTHTLSGTLRPPHSQELSLFSPGKLPPHWVWPLLWAPTPRGFPHPGPDHSGPSLEVDLSPSLTVNTEGAVSKQMLMLRLSTVRLGVRQPQSGPQLDFPGVTVVKNLPASVGDVGPIPGSGRPPPKRNG